MSICQYVICLDTEYPRQGLICPTRPALSFGSLNFESRRAENPSRTYRRLLGTMKSLAKAFPWKSIGKPKENNSEIMIKAMTFQNHVKTYGFLQQSTESLVKNRHLGTSLYFPCTNDTPPYIYICARELPSDQLAAEFIQPAFSPAFSEPLTIFARSDQLAVEFIQPAFSPSFSVSLTIFAPLLKGLR